MCVFIAVSVAGYRGDAALSFRARKLLVRPLPKELGATFPNDGSSFSVDDGHCACSLAVGITWRKDRDLADERRRYERKGWSAAKIERALEAKRLVHERPGQKNEQAQAFADAVEEIAKTRAHVTLLASDFNSSFHIDGKTRLALGDFTANGEFPQNELVTIDV